MTNQYIFNFTNNKIALCNKFGIFVLKKSVINQNEVSFPLYIDKLYYCEESSPTIIAEFVVKNKSFPIITLKDNKLKFYFNALGLIEHILKEKVLNPQPPFYQKIPFVKNISSVRIRQFIYKTLIILSKLKNSYLDTQYPTWPKDISLLIILQLLEQQGYLARQMGIYTGPWPNECKSVVCLSHDVDSYSGYCNMHKMIRIENKYHLKATYNLPGRRYQLDLNFLKSIENDGFEIGIHGYNHKGQTPFLDESAIIKRLQESIERYSPLNIKGYRSSALLRSKKLFDALEKYFEYDSSLPDTENYINGRNFNGSTIPFPFFNNKLLEIPITVPQDGVLIALGYSPKKILNTWLEKISFLKKVRGIIILNTHPDPPFSGNKQMLEIYDNLLKILTADKELHFMTMGQLAEWVKRQI